MFHERIDTFYIIRFNSSIILIESQLENFVTLNIKIFHRT